MMMEVKEISVDGQRQYDNVSFPLVLEPTTACTAQTAVEWVKSNKKWIDDKIAAHGSVVFRGFGITNVEELDAFIKSFGWSFGTYKGGGGPRKIVFNEIHTSTETPPEHEIPFHHELAYLTQYPSKLFFWCEIPPTKEGETPILNSNVLYNKLAEKLPEFVKKVQEKKVRYTRVISDKSNCTNEFQRSWQDTFGTEDRSVAEQLAREVGTDTIEWMPDNSMKVTSLPLDAVRIDPRTNKPTWFNSIVLLHPAAHGFTAASSPWSPTYGDGTPIDDKDILIAKQVMLEEGVKVKWQLHDVLLVDNFLCLHARSKFTPPRRILAAIIAQHSSYLATLILTLPPIPLNKVL